MAKTITVISRVNLLISIKIISVANNSVFILWKKEICILDYLLIFNAVWNVILVRTNIIYSLNTEQTLEEPLARRSLILVHGHSCLVQEQICGYDKKPYLVRVVEGREYTEICYMSVLLNKGQQNTTLFSEINFVVFSICLIMHNFK